VRPGIRLLIRVTLVFVAGLVGSTFLRAANGPVAATPAPPPARVEYRVLATNKTSTMEKEMQDAAEAGFHFGGVMGARRPSAATKSSSS
jgi:hypothetical protein